MGEQASGPAVVDDLCFHTYEEFSPSPHSFPLPPPPGWDKGLEARICLEAGILTSRLGFKAKIWASRLGFESQEGGGDGRT